jgi:CheY-like chemotaxis protein
MNASALHAPSELRDPVKPPLRILVIDDDGCVGAAIQAILARRSNLTELASRAYDGIQALESSKFDAVIVDLFMPGMSGLDTIAHIRRGSAIPIIAMSGFRLRNSLNSFDYLSMAVQRGASAFIRKPFTPLQLIETIDRSVNTTPRREDLTQ